MVFAGYYILYPNEADEKACVLSARSTTSDPSLAPTFQSGPDRRNAEGYMGKDKQSLRL